MNDPGGNALPRRLGRSFYSQPTLEVARALLGQRLVRVVDGRRTSGVVVETEAYIGEEDLACHASAGRTNRTQVMFGPAGHAYVYFVYGMHHCLNIVTEKEGFPAAVLIRALAPAEGIELMAARRDLSERLEVEIGRGGPIPGPVHRSLLRGPGRLCQAMAIDRTLNGESLLGDRLFIERTTDRAGMAADRIIATPRIGVDYAGPWRDKPWRFVFAGSPWVSAAREGRPRGGAARGLRARRRPARSRS
jgi:DNA-3-methyladenine glycosylase